MKIVLQKLIAGAGYCSRRQAEELIRQKKVYVNGQVAELGMKANVADKIVVQGKKISLEKEKIYIIMNKPKDYVCTNKKFKGEKNIFDLMHTHPTPLKRGINERLFAVGRLDKDSRGLIMLTNDGDLAQNLTHPKFEHEKEYIISITNLKLRTLPTVRQVTNEDIVKILKKGVDIGEGDGIVKAKKVEYLGNNKFKIILTEGKKRQIRRMFKTANCEVVDLVRTRIGKIDLGDLKEGKWRKLTEEEITKL